jgi:hypothetical protein
MVVAAKVECARLLSSAYVDDIGSLNISLHVLYRQSAAQHWWVVTACRCEVVTSAVAHMYFVLPACLQWPAIHI